MSFKSFISGLGRKLGGARGVVRKIGDIAGKAKKIGQTVNQATGGRFKFLDKALKVAEGVEKGAGLAERGLDVGEKIHKGVKDRDIGGVIAGGKEAASLGKEAKAMYQQYKPKKKK